MAEQVGIRELKARLSQYVQRARSGDSIVVTDRGRPAAVLGPVPGRLRLDEGVTEGWVTPARRRGLGPAKRHAASGRVTDVLGDDRDE